MILTYGANSLSRSSGGNFVNIGGRDYPYVQIGNQLWLAENLDYRWDGANVTNDVNSGTNTVSRMYVNSNHPEWGTAYNTFAVQDVESRISSTGWRVPTQSDWETLITFIGGMSQGIKLKSTSDWEDPIYCGTDDYGFNAKGYGWYRNDYYDSPAFQKKSTAFMSSYTNWTTQRIYTLYESNNDNIYTETRRFATFAYIRLCKDI